MTPIVVGSTTFRYPGHDSDPHFENSDPRHPQNRIHINFDCNPKAAVPLPDKLREKNILYRYVLFNRLLAPTEVDPEWI